MWLPSAAHWAGSSSCTIPDLIACLWIGQNLSIQTSRQESYLPWKAKNGQCGYKAPSCKPAKQEKQGRDLLQKPVWLIPCMRVRLLANVFVHGVNRGESLLSRQRWHQGSLSPASVFVCLCGCAEMHESGTSWRMRWKVAIQSCRRASRFTVWSKAHTQVGRGCSCNSICHLFAGSLSFLYHGLSVSKLKIQRGFLLIQTHYVSSTLDWDYTPLLSLVDRADVPRHVLCRPNIVCTKGPMMKMIIKWLVYC